MAGKQEIAQVKDLIKGRDFKSAKQACDELLQARPDSFELHVFGGKAAYELGEYQAVRSLFRDGSLGRPVSR